MEATIEIIKTIGAYAIVGLGTLCMFAIAMATSAHAIAKAQR